MIPTPSRTSTSTFCELHPSIDLIDADTDNLLSEIAIGLSNVELDNEMGEYKDDMD